MKKRNGRSCRICGEYKANLETTDGARSLYRGLVFKELPGIMKMLTLKIDNLNVVARAKSPDKICYLLYPFDIDADWIYDAAERYGVSLAVITRIDWANDLTPWRATGVPAGSPDFAGEASRFLTLLEKTLMPEVEQRLGIGADAERTLLGVSLSGLFALWQWLECDLFANIISLSGSFWYDGFVDWVKSRSVPRKPGKAYFLLGNKETQSPVPQFRTVQADTEAIVDYLSAHGIDVTFELVPGNHYQYPGERLQCALSHIFGTRH